MERAGGEPAGPTPLGSVGRRIANDLALGRDDVDRIVPPDRLPSWTSALPVGTLAMDSAALSSLAIAAVGQDRGTGSQHRGIRVDPDRVQASFASDRLLRIDGVAPTVWAPLSGFWRVADGWVRTHANYPHHAERLTEMLGVSVSATPDEFQTALRGWKALDLEQSAAERGALAIAVRTTDEWRRHPQHPVIAGGPVVRLRAHGVASPRPWRNENGLPLAGVRVLDLTRVIAGPVASRDLALAGADVLRVDSPHLPEPSWQHFDTGQGKRSTLLDLADPAAMERLTRLLPDADVVVHGYRPGALARFGLDAETLRARHPGVVVAQLSAWGDEGPWGRRRGFDSLVQAATGIAVLESGDGGATPGALPVQALDHSAGHFLAAAIATALRRQRRHGGSYEVAITLAGVAEALLVAKRTTTGAAEATAPDALPRVTVPVTASAGAPARTVECAPPILAFEGAPHEYGHPLHPWGSDEPAWGG